MNGRSDVDPELFRRPVHQLARDLRSGSCTAREILAHFLTRIERLNPELNAFTFVDPSAMAQAEASDGCLRAGRPRSPLEGIPIAIKDNLWVKNCPAVWGSPLYANHVADHDEITVARLREAGAVLLGKTNLPEFAFRGHTTNPVYGVTRNPWDVKLTPGGSSGGAVAAVAAGLVPLSLATDGGGSIRRPSAHTGLVGLKPTVGRVARGNGFPQLMFDCEVIGPIARNIADIRLMFQCMTPLAPQSKPRPARILFVERIGDAPVDPQILESYRKAVADFAALGHSVTTAALPFSIEAAMAAWQALGSVGLARLARSEPRFDELAAPDFVEQSKQGALLSGADYAQHVETLLDFRARVAGLFEQIDFILMPATAAQPWPVEQAYPTTIDGHPVGPRGHAVFTGWVNACGHPALTIPVSPDHNGLPIGIQLIGAAGADELLLDLAEEYEAVHPWAQNWPPLGV